MNLLMTNTSVKKRKHVLDDNLTDDNDNDEPAETGHAKDLAELGNETAEDAERETTTTEASFTGEENLGEQDEVGGSTPTPVGQDVGEMMAQTMGNDPDPDMDNPQELNMDEEIAKDEKAIRDL